MNSEISKINSYFEEGKRLWQTSPERVMKREFYELWETVQSPVPFLLDGDQFELLGTPFTLPHYDGEKTGYFIWDAENVSPALLLETKEWVQKYLLTFSDGEPRIQENDLVMLDTDELTHGERLEIIYDVIAYTNRTYPSRNVLSLTKKEFIEALDGIGAVHNPRAIATMKRLSAFFMKSLIKKASADMATDEISRQLSLPLDGSYAAQQEPEDNGDSPMLSGRVAPAVIPSKTPWEISSDLNFLNTACRLEAENEREFVLTFMDAEIIGDRGDLDVPFKMHTNPEIPLAQGDVLNVYLRGEKDVFGTFKIDIFDGNIIFGRLRSDFAATVENYIDRLFARLQRSPGSYLSSAVNELWSAVKTGDIKDKLGALEYILALSPFNFTPGNPEGAPALMDLSQRQAWTAAVNPSNAVVLIQGPPGTGKTFVLEQVVRELCRQGLRILVAAPSNTAVDNICRRIGDLPVLRFGKNINSISPDVAEKNWIGEARNVNRFITVRNEQKIGGIYAGTHVGLLRDEIVVDDMNQNGKYDVIIFDEAGMSNLEEFLLCAKLGKRVVLFGDHQQLPPFPLPSKIHQMLKDEFKAVPMKYHSMVSGSAMEWLAFQRGVPVIMLKCSYRCQNPRLLRFSSTLFYDAGVKASESADYYQLAYHERKQKYPPSSLRFYTTSGLPLNKRREHLFIEGQKPGLANPAEAFICCYVFYRAVQKRPLEEISMIVPYRKQVGILRDNLSLEHVRMLVPGEEISEERWRRFLLSRIATVDSFQGGESDVVIISYVRSNEGEGIGFIDNPNRINVAHTRCRREMHIVGDLECLKQQAGNKIFERMERAFRRDGEIIEVSEFMLKEIVTEVSPSL